MTKIIKVSIIALLSICFTSAHANQMQRYDVKSGKIEYALKGSGDVMGMVQIKTVGKKRVIFDDYGVKNLEEKNEVTKETAGGNTKVRKTHTMAYMNNAIIYKVDFKKKIINRMKNQGARMAALFGGGDNLKESGEAMMKSMGGKKLGSDKVLGYSCDVWDLMGVKQCMYKGIPLKIESDVMGMKSVEIATKAEFDITFTKNDFKLPDYPVYDFDMDRMMEGKKPKELDKSKLEAMDAKDNVQAGEDAKEAAQGMKAMGAGMAALTEAGIDMNKELTPEQEQIVQKAMMNAMGGEGKMLAKMKKEILDDTKSIEFAQECFGNADVLEEVNNCIDKGNQMFNEDEEHLTSWTSSEKNKMIQEIEQYQKSIPCVEAAQTMQAIQKCFPEDMR